MFVQIGEERFNVIQREAEGAWVISYDNYQMPVFADQETMQSAQRIATPEEYVRNMTREPTAAMEIRMELIRPLLEEPKCISDAALRRTTIKKIAEEQSTTQRRIRHLYYSYLAHGSLVKAKPRQVQRNPEFDNAIRKHYLSAKRNSLKTAYELFLLENYTNAGKLAQEIPSWPCFRAYYYRHYGNNATKKIARDGLTNFQRNERQLYGSAMQYRQNVGCYQIDESPGDIFLVSKWNRQDCIGRPNIYLAVDTASGLIAGVYVGLDTGENAMMACIANAAADKVQFCAQYGIEIQPEDWPNSGLPYEIMSDRGTEFMGSRIEELCICYGIDLQAMPPFRAEEKPLVERMFGMIQDCYRSMLRGKGIIEEDYYERWATDYRKQAVLTLDEYTAIVIQCIVTLNKSRILTEIGHLPTEAPNTPAALWRWLQENGHDGILHVDEQEVYIRSLPRGTGKITRKGLKHNGMRYQVPYDSGYVAGDGVTYAYNSANANAVYIINEDGSMISCNLAPASGRYEGYREEDIALMQQNELEKRKTAQAAEVAAKVKMRDAIRNIVAGAVIQSSGEADITNIDQKRNRERSMLS